MFLVLTGVIIDPVLLWVPLANDRRDEHDPHLVSLQGWILGDWDSSFLLNIFPFYDWSISSFPTFNTIISLIYMYMMTW
jgi:hypothetical protein